MGSPVRQRLSQALIDDDSDAQHRNRISETADLFASYIDKPNDSNARGSLRDPEFFNKFESVLPANKYGYGPSDFGTLQQNPQYRGIRMVLPQSGGSYGEIVAADGARLAAQGSPRIEQQGPPNKPDPLDPHRNGIPRYPQNFPPDNNGLQQEVYGELIRRGYPVLGGSGEMGGDFQDGFNPVGFGQRDEAATSTVQTPVGESPIRQRMEILQQGSPYDSRSYMAPRTHRGSPLRRRLNQAMDAIRSQLSGDPMVNMPITGR